MRNVGYDDHGAVERQELGNNLWEFVDYNDRLQPEDMRLGTTQDGSQVWRSRLSYDPAGGSCAGQAGGSNNGNVRWQEVTAPIDVGGSLTLCQTYGYDAFNRLTATQEVGSWSRTNSYDAFGNRTVNVGAAQTISPSTNQITAVAGYPTNPPDYDDAGNMIFHPQIGALGYDAENRQTSFSFSGKTGTYVYDGDGHRIKRVSTGIGGSTALFVYDAFDRLAAEYAPTAPSGAAQTEYRTADHLGSTRVVTDGTQAVVARRDFYPFGGRIENTWGGRTQIAAYAEDPGFQQRFTGKERDTESNLDYFLARYYASSLGRFNSVDPGNAGAVREDPQTWNGYGYVRGNPLALVDPTGRLIELAGTEEEREQLLQLLRDAVGSEAAQSIQVQQVDDDQGNSRYFVQLEDQAAFAKANNIAGLISTTVSNPETVKLNIAQSGDPVIDDFGRTQGRLFPMPGGAPGATLLQGGVVNVHVLTPNVDPGVMPPGMTETGTILPFDTTEVLVHELAHAAYAIGSIFKRGTKDPSDVRTESNRVAVDVQNQLRRLRGQAGRRSRHNIR